MDRMAAIERVTESLMLLREGSHNIRRACVELTDALGLLDYEKRNEPLEQREAQVLQFLSEWDGERPPTFARIAEGCGLRSRSYARELCVSLEAKGLVTRLPGRARGVSIIGTAGAVVENDHDQNISG